MKSETKVKYKSPDELIGDNEERSPLSTRVKKNTKAILTKAAKEQNRKVGALAAAILDDYADWLATQGKK
ncbi:MAG: hypothetical protein V4736_03660 [Bdellovibrionota bacterium]